MDSSECKIRELQSAGLVTASGSSELSPSLLSTEAAPDKGAAGSVTTANLKRVLLRGLLALLGS